MINKIFVEFPPGAGGTFLASVLTCCTRNLPWVKEQRTNFHKLYNQIKLDQIQYWHQLAPAPNIIGIDSPDARYNFWINYFKKQIIFELPSYTHHGRRWVTEPGSESNPRTDGFWLLNQCRFIITYQPVQPWKINWVEMLQDPESVWQVIQEFLAANHLLNYWQLDQWISATDDYKQTLSKKIKINTNHVSWQIWATALLQEQGITPSFDLIDNFQKPEFFHWLADHQQNLVETTKNYIWNPG